MDCIDCYAFFDDIGITFHFKMAANYEVITLDFKYNSHQGLQIGLEVNADGKVEYTSEPITLLPKVDGPEVSIPIGPVVLPVSTKLSVTTKIGASISGTASITGASASYSSKTSFGIEYYKKSNGDGDINYPQQASCDFDRSPPTLSLDGSGSVQIWIIPQVHFYIVDWLPLAVNFLMAPYAGIDYDTSTAYDGNTQDGDYGIDWDLFAGLDLTIDTDPVTVSLPHNIYSTTLVDAKSATFHPIQKKILKSGMPHKLSDAEGGREDELV